LANFGRAVSEIESKNISAKEKQKLYNIEIQKLKDIIPNVNLYSKDFAKFLSDIDKNAKDAANGIKTLLNEQNNLFESLETISKSLD
ncbi:hypothetical protein ACP3VS_24620, partial [Lysinibacillus sp. VIII_CA]|uniref:hypothetical protein n=1 Tax=Lysinibacillus sp. VIII_CA TaxID=3417452 RepID=UPI003CF191B5